MSNGPCWEGPDVGLRARVRLADGGPGVALNGREQRSGCSEARLLIGTLRAPISAIEFDARCREEPGQPARVIGFYRLGRGDSISGDQYAADRGAKRRCPTPACRRRAPRRAISE